MLFALRATLTVSVTVNRKRHHAVRSLQQYDPFVFISPHFIASILMHFILIVYTTPLYGRAGPSHRPSAASAAAKLLSNSSHV